MEMIVVESSFIASVGFSEETGVVIEFKDGATFRYPGSSERDLETLLNPPGGSIGKFFHSAWKRAHAGVRA